MSNETLVSNEPAEVPWEVDIVRTYQEYLKTLMNVHDDAGQTEVGEDYYDNVRVFLEQRFDQQFETRFGDDRRRGTVSLSGSEAIYGFCAWLTTREEQTVMSATDDSAPIPPLIAEFCEVNELTPPRDNYADYLTMPS